VSQWHNVVKTTPHTCWCWCWWTISTSMGHF
jgi:hypothetical protein